MSLLRPKLPEFFCRQWLSLSPSDTKDPDCVNVNRVDGSKDEGAFTEQVFAQLSWALPAFRCQRTTLRIVLKGLKCRLKTAQPSCCSFWGGRAELQRGKRRSNPRLQPVEIAPET